MTIRLRHPDFRLGDEKLRADPYMRQIRVLKHLAHLNGFDSKLRRALGDIYDIDDSPVTDVHARVTRAQQYPFIKKRVQEAEQYLKRELNDLKHGYKPILEPIRYRFRDENGRVIVFTLDPDKKAKFVLLAFEKLVNQLPNGDIVEAQFHPLFRMIKRKMVDKYEWEKEDCATQAMLLAMKRVCDFWHIDK